MPAILPRPLAKSAQACQPRQSLVPAASTIAMKVARAARVSRRYRESSTARAFLRSASHRAAAPGRRGYNGGMDEPLQFRLRTIFWLTTLVAVGCLIVPPIWNAVAWMVVQDALPVLLLVGFAVPIVDILRG
jgi:hypothetical protein